MSFAPNYTSVSRLLAGSNSNPVTFTHGVLSNGYVRTSVEPFPWPHAKSAAFSVSQTTDTDPKDDKRPGLLLKKRLRCHGALVSAVYGETTEDADMGP